MSKNNLRVNCLVNWHESKNGRFLMLKDKSKKSDEVEKRNKVYNQIKIKSYEL